MGINSEHFFTHYFQTELVVRSVLFLFGGKLENVENKPEFKDKKQQQTQPTCQLYLTLDLGFECRP